MERTEKAQDSIYRSADAEADIFALYSDYLARWPVPVTATDITTRYGRVHVLISGPQDGRPVLLLHAASMASISWLPNVTALADAGFRTFAVDHIGEAGLSRLTDMATYPDTPQQIGTHYVEVADQLGIDAAPVVAASAGGHAALRFALAAPERVLRLALLGPMGITPLSLTAMLRMMLASLVPAEGVATRTSRWALGTDPAVVEGYGRWFATVLRSVGSPPRVGRPVALSAEEMARTTCPVQLILGDRDKLVGDAARASEQASSFPDVRTETFHRGHLVGVERADEVNALIVPFLQDGTG